MANNRSNITSNDDSELDKLIQETQDIWKSLKNSGVEIKHDDPSNTNLEEFDAIASRLNNSNLNISNANQEDSHFTLNTVNGVNEQTDVNLTDQLTTNPLNISAQNNTDITLEDTSRTLQGLNLATPTNELSSLLFNDEPSKLSQIRFSTPMNLKSATSKGTRARTQKDDESIPDTPFLFSSPSMARHPVDDTMNTLNSHNLTLSSPLNQIRVDDVSNIHRDTDNHRDHVPVPKHSAKPIRAVVAQIDFTENYWHEVNGLLSRNGFSVLVKEHDSAPEIQICRRFKEILRQFQDHKGAALQNKELKTQLHISSEKVGDLKQEVAGLKQKVLEQDNSNDSMLINVKRQLEHCKGIVNQRNDEISRLKQKLQTAIEKEAVRRESAEAVFENIHKRNARKNSKKDQEQMDLMAMYDEERKKMQNEIKFLRKEMRTLNQKLLEKSTDDEDKENTSKRGRRSSRNRNKHRQSQSSHNISFTPSRRQSDDSSDDAADRESSSGDDDVVVDLKWKTKREIKKQIDAEDLVRAKDLSRLEAQKLREKLDTMYRKREGLEADMERIRDQNATLQRELEKRPSYNEWTRLKQELNSMNKKLMETSKVASLRKYMDTRELIRRDKEIHNLGLTDVDGMPIQIMREILQDLCRILSIKDVTVLVDSVAKITKCVECVPILEQYISKIVRTLIASDHAPELIKISKVAPKNIFDQVLPVLKDWIIKLDKVEALTSFRVKVDEKLRKRTVYIDSQKKQHGGAEVLGPDGSLMALHDIVKQIDELVQSEEYLLNSKHCFNSAEKELVKNPEDLCNRIIRHFQHIFTVKSIEGVFPKMNQIYLELNEMRNFLKTIKSILGLGQNCAINLCFKELSKMVDEKNENTFKLDNMVKEMQNNERNPTVITKWNDILIEIQRLFQCQSEDEIVNQCQELLKRCKDYDAVFPRVNNLINQLRVTLNVEYAHQILPKVKELVGV